MGKYLKDYQISDYSKEDRIQTRKKSKKFKKDDYKPPVKKKIKRWKNEY